jgi:hypothetical protein
MIGPVVSNIGRIAPWALSGLSMLPNIPGAVNAAGKFFNQPAAPYNPGGGGMGGRRGTSGRATSTKPTGSLRDYGTGYKEEELRAGAAAESFRSGAGFPGQQAAAERAYQSEASRVAQLTAQDPELQRYEAARLKAVAPGATPEQVQSAEDIGMQMWAKANPTLAAKVKAGQSGYEAIQGTLAGNMARAGQGFGVTEQLVPTPQGFPTQVPGLPTGAGYSTGFGVTSNLAPGAQTPPPYSTIKPTSELSGLGAAPLGTATTSVFGQPNVMDAAKFEELLKLVKK